ncbi:hypothetical protein EV426DRAFT_530211, partial [Tirmania nivea]
HTVGAEPFCSPIYLDLLFPLHSLIDSLFPARDAPIKPVIISITGSPEDIISGLERISNVAEGVPSHMPLWVEIYLSCPNIPDKPPLAYGGIEVTTYIHAVASWKQKMDYLHPPYTYLGQFQAVVGALAAASDAVDFIIACNSLGTSQERPFLVALVCPRCTRLRWENVCTLRKLLGEYESGELRDVGIIGVGGVCDGKTLGAMQRAGADVVGVGVEVGVGWCRLSGG